MPFVQRVVSPRRLSRVSLHDENGKPRVRDDELEAVTNFTLCSALRQLASVVQIAGDIFVELNKELSSVKDRSGRLKERIAKVEQKVLEYDPKAVTVQLGEFLNFEVVVDSNQANFMDAEVGVNEGSRDRQWTRPMTLYLIQEYKSRIATVGRSVKTLKQLFKILANVINTTFKTNFNGDHISNKWKTLERAYKKKKDNDSRTGRGAKHFEYEEFLDEIYLKSPKIHPLLTLSETEKVLPPPPTPQIITTSKSCPRVGASTGSTPEIEELTQGPSPPQKCRQKNTRNDVLDLMRKDRLNYYEKRLKQQDLKIEQRDNRIQVLKEMKDLLKVYLEKKDRV